MVGSHSIANISDAGSNGFCYFDIADLMLVFSFNAMVIFSDSELPISVKKLVSDCKLFIF